MLMLDWSCVFEKQSDIFYQSCMNHFRSLMYFITLEERGGGGITKENIFYSHKTCRRISD